MKSEFKKNKKKVRGHGLTLFKQQQNETKVVVIKRGNKGESRAEKEQICILIKGGRQIRDRQGREMLKNLV